MSLREESVLQPRVYKVFRVRGTECGRKEHMMADPDPDRKYHQHMDPREEKTYLSSTPVSGVKDGKF